jgi:pectate lyase
MKTLSLKRGLLFLLVGVVGASCTKDVNEAPLNASSTDETTVMASSSSSTSVGTPIGFASVNGKTTGGAGGKTVTVSSFSALKKAAASSSRMIIIVKGTIKGSSGITVKSNKTIIGQKGATLDGPGLLMYRVSNIIVKNLTIKNARSTDGITIKDRSHHVWIDHCTFTNPRYDGNVDITKQSDFVTISWSKFSDSDLNLLIGGGDGSTSDKGKLNVTLHHNYFSDISERNPSFRFGKGHVFNNYYEDIRGYGIAARMGATIYAENNYFQSIKGNPLVTIGPKQGYFSGVSTNTFKSSGKNKIQTSASSWKPTYSYKSALISAASVPSVVKAGAGAK